MEGVIQSEAMRVNKDRLFKLMDDMAASNYRELARQLGVGVSQLHRILNKDSKAGPVFLGKLRTFCKEKGLIFDEFISDCDAVAH